MAEHPGAMEPGEFDLVGFAVGVADRDRLLTGEHVAPGDVLIGLPSPGLRSNGYSLARRVLLDRAGLPLDGPAFEGCPPHPRRRAARPLGDLRPGGARRHGRGRRAAPSPTSPAAASPATSTGCCPRAATPWSTARTWEAPRIFGEIQRLGEVADDEMAKVFNLGIGMVVVVPADDAFRAIDVLRSHGHQARTIGSVEAGSGAVTLV